MPAPVVGRRALLGAAALSASCLSLTGCSAGRSPRAPAPQPTSDTAHPDPDLAILARTVAGVDDLVRACVEASTAPHMAVALAPLVADHRAHLAALHAYAPATTPSARATARAGATPPPGLSALTRLEREQAAERRRDLLLAGGPLARLLASIAACESVHVSLLSGVGRRTA